MAAACNGSTSSSTCDGVTSIKKLTVTGNPDTFTVAEDVIRQPDNTGPSYELVLNDVFNISANQADTMANGFETFSSSPQGASNVHLIGALGDAVYATPRRQVLERLRRFRDRRLPGHHLV